MNVLATEALAAALIRPAGFPTLTGEEIVEARGRLTRAFQRVWLEEHARLTQMGAAR